MENVSIGLHENREALQGLVLLKQPVILPLKLGRGLGAWLPAPTSYHYGAPPVSASGLSLPETGPSFCCPVAPASCHDLYCSTPCDPPHVYYTEAFLEINT